MSRDLRYLSKMQKQNLYPPLNRMPPLINSWHFERAAEHFNHAMASAALAAADLSIRKDIPKLKDKHPAHFSSSPSIYNSTDETIDLSMKKRKHIEEDNVVLNMSSKPSPAPLDLNCSKKAKSYEHTFPVKHSRQSQKKHYHHNLIANKEITILETHSSSSGSPDRSTPLEETPFNGHINGFDASKATLDKKVSVHRELTEEEKAKRDKQIRKLKLELFNEEMKLVLLKKIQQSQMTKENAVSGNTVTVSPSLPEKMHSSINRSTVTPPPLIRSNSTSSTKSLHHHSTTHQPPPPPASSKLVSNPRPSIHLPPPSTGPPPPLVLGTSNQRVSSRSTPVSSATPPYQPYNYHALGESMRQSSGTPPDTQTPAQRQAAAKLALRKQLEKTLLQIPPPKPPPPEMHFLPNGNNQEFVYLLGLEWIVNLVVDETYGTQSPPAPFECSQCGTDFTPVWKWKDTSGSTAQKSPAVVCESCVTSNIKKALKAEHTNRLKTAFVKALQQEQEIEQRLATSTTTSTTTPPPSSSPGNLLPPPPPPPPARSSPLFPKLTPAQQSFLQAHQLQQLAQSLPQPAHMLPTTPFPPPLLAAAAYSYQMLASAGKQSTDLQRQYLLDMIPPCTSQSGWKT